MYSSLIFTYLLLRTTKYFIYSPNEKKASPKIATFIQIYSLTCMECMLQGCLVKEISSLIILRYTNLYYWRMFHM